MEVQEEGVNFN